MRRSAPAGAPSSLYPKDWINFAPRLSVADDLLGNGKLVIRTGAGIFYDGASQDFFVGNQAYNTNAGEAGPAFNSIGFASPVVSTITAGVPIFGDYTPSSVFTVDQNLTTPRYASYNLNIESQLTKNIALASRVRRLAGPSSLPLPRSQPGQQRAGRMVSCGNGQTISLWQVSASPLTPPARSSTYRSTTSTRSRPAPISNYNSAADHAEGAELARPDLHAELHLGPLDRHGQRRAGLCSQRVTARRQLQSPRRARQLQLRCAPARAVVLDLQSAQVRARPSGSQTDGRWTACSTLPPASHTRSATSLKAITTAAANTLAGPTSSAIRYAGASGTNLLNMAAFAAPCTVDTMPAARPTKLHQRASGQRRPQRLQRAQLHELRLLADQDLAPDRNG